MDHLLDKMINEIFDILIVFYFEIFDIIVFNNQ
jgi:hypothetical protein